MRERLIILISGSDCFENGQDIYNRQYTGDADVDPPGGRKRPPSTCFRVLEFWGPGVRE